MKKIIALILTGSLCLLALTGCMTPVSHDVTTGQQALHAKDYTKAIHYYQQAANRNEPQAEYALGYMYYYGLGVPKNLKIAIDWWVKASTWGYKPAQHALQKLDRDMPFFQ